MEGSSDLKFKEITAQKKYVNESGENRKTIGKNETKSWFFEKLNEIDKPLGRLRIKREDSNN